MARAIFDIAKEIKANWTIPSPQAKAYLKGMFYLLGMDDRAGDLDADTTLRMFLLYAKDWNGSVASRIKDELRQMRASRQPTCAELLKENQYPAATLLLDSCEMCSASLGVPGKFVESYSQWQKQARMCLHCNYFAAIGLDEGDGGLYFQAPDGTWAHLHGEPTLLSPPERTVREPAREKTPRYQPRIRHLVKKIVRRVGKKCLGALRRVLSRGPR